MVKVLGKVHEFDSEVQVVLNSLGRQRPDVDLLIEEYQDAFHPVHKEAFLGVSEVEAARKLSDLRAWLVSQLERMGEVEAARRLAA